MDNDLSPQQVIGWLRRHAKQLADAADSLEQTFSPCAPHHTNGRAATESPQSTVTVDQIATALGSRKRRIGELAKELGTHQAFIEPLISEENGFHRSVNGWITREAESVKHEV